MDRKSEREREKQEDGEKFSLRVEKTKRGELETKAYHIHTPTRGQTQMVKVKDTKFQK